VIITYLDMRTLITMTGAQGAFIAASLVYLVRVQKVYPGIVTWAVGSLAGCAGLSLLGLQGVIPDVFGVVVANVVGVGAYVLLMRGLSSFTGRPQKTWLDAGTLAVAAGALSLFLWAWPDLNARIITYSAAVAFVAWRSFATVIRGFPSVVGRRSSILGATYAVVASWFTLRGVLALFAGEPGQSLMTAGILQRLTVLAAFSTNFLLASGLIIANSQRLQKDLAAARQEVKTLSGLLPICSHCKKIRDPTGAWLPVEAYVGRHSEALFSHTVCPQCMKVHYGELEE